MSIINRVQRGTLAIPVSASNFGISNITMVDMTKSMVKFGGFYWGSSPTTGATIKLVPMGPGAQTSSTRVEIHGPYNYNYTNYAYYEVIEFT